MSAAISLLLVVSVATEAQYKCEVLHTYCTFCEVGRVFSDILHRMLIEQ